MTIGRKLYYELETGNVLVDTGERAGDIVETTIEQDFRSYAALAKRVPESIGCIQLEYGEYSEEFAKYSFRIDPPTKKILWGTLTDNTSADLEQMKVAKVSQLNDFCNKEIAGGFQSAALGTTYTYPSDPEAQMNFNLQMTRMLANPGLDSIHFKTLDVGYMPHTREQFTTAFNDGLTHGEGLIAKYNTLKAQVQAATTVEEVDAIQW